MSDYKCHRYITVAYKWLQEQSYWYYLCTLVDIKNTNLRNEKNTGSFQTQVALYCIYHVHNSWEICSIRSCVLERTYLSTGIIPLKFTQYKWSRAYTVYSTILLSMSTLHHHETFVEAASTSLPVHNSLSYNCYTELSSQHYEAPCFSWCTRLPMSSSVWQVCPLIDSAM